MDFEHIESSVSENEAAMLSLAQLARRPYMHIYLYSFDKQDPMAADAKLERQLEKGDYEVLGIEGVDEAAGTVFFWGE
jgi:hypothetical protein